MEKLKLLSFNNISFWVLFVAAVLLPIFFIPLVGFPIEFSKGVMLGIAAFFSLFILLIARLRDGEIALPKSYILGSCLIISIVFFLSSIFSTSFKTSFFGLGGETATSLMLFILFLVMFLASLLFQDKNRIFYFYSTLIIVSLVIFAYQLIKLFIPTFLSFGLFNSVVSSTLGSWNDLSIFSGLIAILVIITLEFLSFSKSIKILLYAIFVLSVFFLTLTNFSLSWILVGIFSIIVFVYSISFGSQYFKKEKSEKIQMKKIANIAILPLLLLIISILFLLPGNIASDYLSSQFNISYLEARPSFATTFEITKETIKSNPLLGSGANLFSKEWLLHKDRSVNETIFWNTDFDFGIGTILSFASMGGLLGILSWLLFFGFFIIQGSQAVLTTHTDGRSAYLILSSFLAALYLWCSAIFYVPGVVLFSFAFLFTGIFIAILVKEHKIKNITFSFTENPRVGFVSVLVIILLMITCVVAEYSFAQRILAAKSFGNGILAFNIDGDLTKAESNIIRSLHLFEHDSSYRTLSEIQIRQLGFILSQSDIGQDTMRTQFQAKLGSAITSAQNAISFNEAHYLNWLALGRVYESIIPLGIAGAYDNAINSYMKAIELNPTDPSLYLTLARTEIANGNNESAKKRITDALSLKNNYTEAIFVLSQIEESEGNLKGAILAAEQASLVSPNDVGVFFQLGLLRYKNGDYKGAISALERAVILNPVYSNAKYFLGLSYKKIGRNEDAIAQFEDIKYLNPGNIEVENILSNLKSGRNPFANIVPPNEPPEERDEPPIEE